MRQGTAVHHHPASPDYEPDLGELRRVLEEALAESKDGEKYVFPRAARLYLSTRKDEKTGRIYFPGRDTIYSKGKALFAKALFADEPEDAEIVTDGDGKPAPTVEGILAAVEALVGAKVKARSSKGATVRDLMKDNGVDLDTIRLWVGHTTCDMTLEYYNPTQKQAAEKARRIILRRNHAQALADGPGTRRAHTPPQLSAPPTDAPQTSLDALREALAALTPEERAQLLTSAD